MFINPGDDFRESPFIFLLLILTWLFGSLLALSEMVKAGELTLQYKTSLKPERSRPAAMLYTAVAVACLLAFMYAWLGARLGLTAEIGSTIARIGYLTLAPLGAILATMAAIPLWRNQPHAALLGGAVALLGLFMAIPVLIAGTSWLGLLMILLAIAALAILWNSDVQGLFAPMLIVFGGGLLIGLSFALIHAAQIRAGMIAPPGLTQMTSEAARRLMEAENFAGILTVFYLFVFGLPLVWGLFTAVPTAIRQKAWITPYGIVALALLLPLAFYLVQVSNLRVIQADMIYKRGKPFDSRAVQLRNTPEALQMWDNSIAVYEGALSYTPREDFYYLWLGRAYLEKSGIVTTPAERDAILSTAQRSLLEAQRINPLNTDHTANLARLNTRWASLLPVGERDERLSDAERFYKSAIQLSPQNAVIRNEYARMAYSFNQDCPRGIQLYQESIAADPLYARTFFEMAEIYQICAPSEQGDDPDAYYQEILAIVREGERLATEMPGREGAAYQTLVPQAWAQVGQFFDQNEAWSYAIIAYEQLLTMSNSQLPEWNIQFRLAQAYFQDGQLDLAVETATAALANAPADAAPLIQQFLADLES